MNDIELMVGKTRWSLHPPPGGLVTPRSRAVEIAPISDIRAAILDALDHPLRLDIPLRRAFTPDDRIALVIDEGLPQLGELVAGVLHYLATSGIGPAAVTIITAPGARRSDWIDELPDEFADVHTEVHQPDDRKLLSYLATTQEGRRVYMNRTLIDADQIIVLSGRGYDSQLGYAGGEGALYPALSDAESRRALASQFSTANPEATPNGVRREAIEIASLLASTIYVHVVEGAGDTLCRISAGLINCTALSIQFQDERWRLAIEEPADVVIAAIAGDPHRHDFSVLARAAASAARAVKEQGCIVILSDAEPTLGMGLDLLRQAGDPSRGLRLLSEHKPLDHAEAFQWASAAEHARLYLVSGMKPEIVEDIFATPTCSPQEVQRLIDGGGTCLVLPDAAKTLVVIE